LETYRKGRGKRKAEEQREKAESMREIGGGDSGSSGSREEIRLTIPFKV
jgi:hypothetical protein